MSHYRCSACRARQRLNKPPHEYIRAIFCRSCGERIHAYWTRGQTHLTVDRYRIQRERGRKAPKCRCHGYSFAHRPRSGFCLQNPNLTDEALQAREAEGRWS